MEALTSSYELLGWPNIRKHSVTTPSRTGMQFLVKIKHLWQCKRGMWGIWGEWEYGTELVVVDVEVEACFGNAYLNMPEH